MGLGVETHQKVLYLQLITIGMHKIRVQNLNTDFDSVTAGRRARRQTEIPIFKNPHICGYRFVFVRP